MIAVIRILLSAFIVSIVGSFLFDNHNYIIAFCLFVMLGLLSIEVIRLDIKEGRI